MSSLIASTKLWLKQSPSPAVQGLVSGLKAARTAQLPRVPGLFAAAYQGYRLASQLFGGALRILVWTPLFRSQVQGSSKALYLYGGLPLISQGLEIEVGDNCRISGRTTLSGRLSLQRKPYLKIGNNVDLGWQSTVAVGTRVTLGDNVRIASGAFLAGYPGHPVDPLARAQGLPELEQQRGEIILEDDVWLATNVTVLAGVTIGKGSIVASGSVVTKSLPAGVLAAGSPAKIIKQL